jgi:putative transposase
MMKNGDKECRMSDSSPHRLLPGAPTKARPLVGVDVITSEERSKIKNAYVSEFEEDLAFKRRVVFEKLADKKITRDEAVAELNVKLSRFYTLYDEFRESKDYTGMIRGKRGPKPGSMHASELMLATLQDAFAAKYIGPKAGAMVVLRKAEQLCQKRGLPRPTKYLVSKFIKSKPPRELYTLKFGEEAAAQKYDHRPGYIEDSPEDADVQADHTLVDILLVDEKDRSCIVGRPWLTIIICTLTRVILGYFLSFRNPCVITVQLALIAAFLPKDNQYNPLKADPYVYPFSGVPPGCYTDNAAEFITQQLILKCVRWGMDWDHRPIGKKWYGGIVERVIGTFMTGSVHFLPGSTGSNSVERVYFKSELNATMTLPEFCEWFAHEVTKYHSRRHDALGCSPRMAWAELRGKGAQGELPQISQAEALSFALDFMPSEYGLKIHNYGINFASRRYWGEELIGRIGLDCEIRYDPSDLQTIWVLLDSTFINIGCNRMRKGDSLNYESYRKSITISRHDPDRRLISVGSHTDEYGLEAEEHSDAIVSRAITNTARSKVPGSVEFEELPQVSADRAIPPIDSKPAEGGEAVDDLKPNILIDPDDF